jgi:hypothetical protein
MSELMSHSSIVSVSACIYMLSYNFIYLKRLIFSLSLSSEPLILTIKLQKILLRCQALSFVLQLPTFRRIAADSSSGSRNVSFQAFWLWRCTTFLWNVVNYNPTTRRTSQKTWIFSNAAMRNSNLAIQVQVVYFHVLLLTSLPQPITIRSLALVTTIASSGFSRL